jgi:hypothetical protein
MLQYISCYGSGVRSIDRWLSSSRHYSERVFEKWKNGTQMPGNFLRGEFPIFCCCRNMLFLLEEVVQLVHAYQRYIAKAQPRRRHRKFPLPALFFDNLSLQPPQLIHNPFSPAFCCTSNHPWSPAHPHHRHGDP